MSRVDRDSDIFTFAEHGPYRKMGAHTYSGASAPGVSWSGVLRKRIVKYGKGFNKAIILAILHKKIIRNSIVLQDPGQIIMSGSAFMYSRQTVVA
jgi:hypothetical protein